jgi:D-3-phosphoglycerate dehydrogenase
MTAGATVPTYYIIDFDSTFTKVEGLDELARIALEGQPNQQQVVGEIVALTDSAMNGELAFSEGLRRRIALLSAHKNHLAQLIEFLSTQISDSFLRNKAFLEQHSANILIVSSGFKEFIVPIVTQLGILEKNVYANEFRFDEAGNIIGIDEANVLASDGGKKKLLRQLQLPGQVCAIGDGYTDYELKEAGLAHRFYAFVENVKRLKVINAAEYVAASLDEVIAHQQQLQAMPGLGKVG